MANSYSGSPGKPNDFRLNSRQKIHERQAEEQRRGLEDEIRRVRRLKAEQEITTLREVEVDLHALKEKQRQAEI